MVNYFPCTLIYITSLISPNIMVKKKVDLVESRGLFRFSDIVDHFTNV